MSIFASKQAREFYAQTYEATVPDWPGEIDFYRELAAEAHADGQAVLEVACGTGRVAIRLAREGLEVTGLDLSSAMLDVAREKSAGLGNMCWVQGGIFETTQEFAHPRTGRQVRTLQAWSYEPATQTAISHKLWEELGPEGQVVDRLDRGPIQLHVVYRFEMEHLLARAGFTLTALYGDFFRQEFGDGSSEMIWVAKRIE